MSLTDASGFTGNTTTTLPTVFSVAEAGANYMFRGIAFAPSQLVTLPIDLLSFKAYLVGKNALLNWATSHGINAKEFIIEKSLYGRTFTTLTKVTPQNNPNGSSYSFTDYGILNGQIYYRLKSVDKDGIIKYSKVVTIRIDKTVDTDRFIP